MSDGFPLLEEAEAFRQVRAGGRPIFRWDSAEYATFYAPGYVCVVGLPDADSFETTIQVEESGVPNLFGSPSDQGQGVAWGPQLWRQADLALAEARRWQEEPFRPECLTLYMNNECNLGCVYCHTDPLPGPAPRLEPETIAVAAEVVAVHCRQKGRPLYGVFHGGGEPTLHQERVERALALLDRAASAHDVELFRYVATNGVMSEKKAAWLARHFDLIGLSCDGPAEIQNRQRPGRDGGTTAHVVERTGRILREEGGRFHVRTTITRATLSRQAEIADYICQQFSPEEIHFEPVYLGGRTSAATGLGAHQAGEFVANFLKARQVAREHGILLATSGSRPDALHGPYCHVFRDTLNLVPGGVATACFKVTTAAQVEEKGAAIGALNRESGRFEIDQPRVRELCQRLDALPAGCTDCFNRYHCVRACPDYCPLEGNTRPDHGAAEPGFRCLAQKALAYAIIREAAERLWSARVKAGAARGTVHGTAILRSVLPPGSGGD